MTHGVSMRDIHHSASLCCRAACLLGGVLLLAACSSDSGNDTPVDAADTADSSETDTSMADLGVDVVEDVPDLGRDAVDDPGDGDVELDAGEDGGGDADDDADVGSADADELDTTVEDAQPDADVGAPSNADLAFADCVAMHEEFCARLYTPDCGPNTDAYRPQMEEVYGITDEASCLEVVMPEACELVTEPYRRGYQTFDAEVAAECRSNMFALPCDAFFGFDPHVSELANCGDFIVGLQEEGERCFEDYSCVDGVYCPDLSVNRVLQSNDELGTCVPPRGDGEVCQFNNEHCEGALVCHGRLCGPAE